MKNRNCIFLAMLFALLFGLVLLKWTSLVLYGFVSLYIPIFIWMFSFLYLGKNKRILMVFFACFMISYIAIQIEGYIYGQYIEYKLSQFDLDGDGFFSKEEQTKEQKKYMQILVNDLGRNLLPITGLIYSGLITAYFAICLSTCNYISSLIGPSKR